MGFVEITKNKPICPNFGSVQFGQTGSVINPRAIYKYYKFLVCRIHLTQKML